MRVLVVGSGGREHALCWKLRQSPLLDELYCAPGNPGIAEVADVVSIQAEEIKKLADFAVDLKVDLTIVGPELPLTLGLADEFRSRELGVFGPRKQAAELEGSKVFAKEFMQRHGIPTADSVVVHERREAEKAARKFGFPVVLKADGLAAGKGVLIPQDKRELAEALDAFFVERRFGASGDRIIVERHLVGEEVSLIALSDGRRLLPLATSKDYKRLLDNDCGPNTGGMGSHSPSGVLSGRHAGDIMERVMRPVVSGMAEENRPFEGFLYAGLILTEDGPQVLEFNVRLGDPEAQSILLRLEDDLLPVLAEGAAGFFETERIRFRKEAAVCLVLAAAGYPDNPVKGDPIQTLATAPEVDGVEIFHAGTALDGGQVITAGGRVLNVCATGLNLREALRKAYLAAGEIRWPGAVLRSDVGRRVLTMMSSESAS
ncbi:MAG: phosphoribosylamine--glycine ligase [Acidobacteriota bacterium]|nr:phosphoribosylamine--glycine ligase [Acidobacteriota bacterium]